MTDFASLPARVEALAERLHIPGYPAEQAPIVRALAKDVSDLLAAMQRLEAEHASVCNAAGCAREAAAAAVAEAEARATAAEAAAAMAAQSVRSEMLAKVDAAAAAFRHGAAKVVAAHISAAVRDEGA